MNAVLGEEFSALISCHEFVLIFLVMTLGIGLLYATSTGSVITCNGEAHHATVSELHRLLNQSLSECTTSYDGSPVIVLDGTCKDLARTGTGLVHKYHQGECLEGSSSVAIEFLARAFPSLGIDDKAVLGQKFVGHLNGYVHVSSRISSEVHNQTFHSFDVQLCQGHQHLGIGLFSKVLHSDVSRFLIDHIIGIHAYHGYVPSDYSKVCDTFHSMSHDAQLDLAALLAFEMLHHFQRLHADERFPVCTYYAVSCHQTHFLGRSSVDDRHDIYGVLLYHETDAYAAELSSQVVVSLLGILCAQITAVWVQFLEDTGHGILHQLGHIDGIHIIVIYNLQEVTQLVGTRIDDAQTITSKVTGTECAYEYAYDDTQRDEQWGKTPLVVIVHSFMLCLVCFFG